MTGFRLTREELARRDEITNRAGAAAAALASAVETFNEKVAAAFEELKTAAAEYNEAREAAADFATSVAERLRELHFARSEKWQEGEKGQEADAFVSAWEEFAPEDFEPEEPMELDGPGDELVDALNELPEAVSP